MTIHDVAQLSPDWHELRRGIPTASDFHRIIQAKSGLPSKSQEGYARQLCEDIKCLNPKYFSDGGKPVNVHIERGRNLEEEAIAWYAMTRNVETRRVGFVATDDGRFGCSPDALIIHDGKYVGGIEVKCPAVEKHDKHIKRGSLPLTYKAQTHGGISVTGLPYWVFLEYCPDSITPTLCLRVEPDEFTQALKVQLEVFDEMFSRMKQEAGIRKDVEVTDSDKIEAWRVHLSTRPDMATLNEWLPELSEIPDRPTKLACWKLCEAYGAAQGWTFNRDARKFELAKVA